MMQLFGLCAIVVWSGAKVLQPGAQRQNIDLESLFFLENEVFFRKRVDGQRKFPERPVHGAPGRVLDEETAKKLGISTEKAVRLIPYHSIGRAHGLLRAVTVSELYLERRTGEKDCRCDGCGRTAGVGAGRADTR